MFTALSIGFILFVLIVSLGAVGSGSPVLTEAMNKAFQSATPEQRGAYFRALRDNDAATANAAGAVFGFTSEHVAHEMQSDAINGLREQAAAEKQAEVKEKYERLSRVLTPAQALSAASMELPQSTLLDAPNHDNLTPEQKLYARGGISKGEAAFAAALKIPQ